MLGTLFRLLGAALFLTVPAVVYNLQHGMELAEAVREVPSAYEDGFHWVVETVGGQVDRLGQPGNGPTPTPPPVSQGPDAAGRQGVIRSLEDGRALTDLMERVVLEETNRRRQEAGVGLLYWDAELAGIAKAHSEDMAEHDYFAHENLQGQEPADRAEEAGYRCRRFVGLFVTGVGENLYRGWLFRSYTERNGDRTYDYLTAREIGARAVDSLMESPGHRENILAEHYEALGVGVAVSDGQQVYVTQKFC